MASAVEKPVLRGLLKRQVKFHFMGMLVTAVTAVSLVKHFYTDKRKRQHDEFWSTYDPDKDYIRMREKGVFQSVPPKGNNEP